MIRAQALESQRARQRTRIPYLQSIGEQTDLHGRVAVIIPVDNGVDNGLTYGIRRHLENGGSSDA